MPALTAGAVLTTSRTLLNDDNAALWTDPSLFPKLAQAHRELQTMLRSYAAPVMQATSAGINVASAATTILLPTDLVEPIILWEKTNSASDTTYIRMTEQYPLDVTAAQQGQLIYWQWQDEVITFIGATTNRTVKMLYWRALPIPVASGDSVTFTNGELYLAPRTAALAAMSVENKDRHDLLTGVATASIEQVILANRGRLKPANGMTMRP